MNNPHVSVCMKKYKNKGECYGVYPEKDIVLSPLYKDKKLLSNSLFL